MDEDVLFRIQGAWENPEQIDECIVCMNDFEQVMMMMSYLCSGRSKNQPNAIYTKGTVHHTTLFRGPSTNGMKK